MRLMKVEQGGKREQEIVGNIRSYEIKEAKKFLRRSGTGYPHLQNIRKWSIFLNIVV